MFAPDTVRLNAKEAEGVRLASQWKTHPDRPRRGDDGSVKYLFSATQPTLVRAPLDTCNIILQGGKTVNGVHVGDKPRWKIIPDTMGAGENAATMLAVKPVDVGLTTTLTVTTDRRLYSIKLMSKAKGLMPNMPFDYPDDTDCAQVAYREQRVRQTYSNTMPGAGGQSLASLDSGFRSGGDNLSWKSVRVYTNRAKTYIQFPTSNFGGEAPALVAKGNGGWFSKTLEKLINYRPTGDRHVVDRIIDKVSLIVGVGSDQTEVMITQTGGKRMVRFQLMVSLATALLPSACVTSRPTMSYVEPSVTATDSIMLSREAVAYLADALLSARIMLVPDPPAAKDQDHLTAALLSALRARGYGVTLADPKIGRPAGQGVALRYLASPFDGSALMRLQYQGTEASRYYPRGTNGLLLPGVPLMIRGGRQ